MESEKEPLKQDGLLRSPLSGALVSAVVALAALLLVWLVSEGHNIRFVLAVPLCVLFGVLDFVMGIGMRVRVPNRSR